MNLLAFVWTRLYTYFNRLYKF